MLFGFVCVCCLRLLHVLFYCVDVHGVVVVFVVVVCDCCLCLLFVRVACDCCLCLLVGLCYCVDVLIVFVVGGGLRLFVWFVWCLCVYVCVACFVCPFVVLA